MKHNANDLHMV